MEFLKCFKSFLLGIGSKVEAAPFAALSGDSAVPLTMDVWVPVAAAGAHAAVHRTLFPLLLTAA